MNPQEGHLKKNTSQKKRLGEVKQHQNLGLNSPQKNELPKNKTLKNWTLHEGRLAFQDQKWQNLHANSLTVFYWEGL